MEIDLNQGAEIIYLVPNTYMSIRDFQKYLCVGIQTRGYEDMTEGDNLLISIAVVGRLSNNDQVRYNLNIDGIVDVVASQEELAGLEWEMRRFIEDEASTSLPRRALHYENSAGQEFIRFTSYEPRHQPLEDNEQFLQEEIRSRRDDNLLARRSTSF
ncbi:Polyprotein P3 [Nymphaea thermarum]|nr:Polyprotein P3 [Nymphaea thermarum]